MDIRGVLAALRWSWWLPVLGLLIGGVAGFSASSMQTPMYTAYTQLFVSTTGSASNAEAYQGSQLSQQRVASYAQLLTGEEVANRVVARLGLQVDPRDLTSRITATAVPETVLLNVAVMDASPVLAQRMALAIGEEFPDLVKELETPEQGAASPVRVTVTDRPEVAASPSSPPLTSNVLLGSLVGVLAGAAVSILRVALDRSIKDPEEVAEIASAPVIATVLRDARVEKDHIVVRSGDNRTAEDYRQLRTNLQFLSVDEPPKVIMVSSAVPSEGKTTVVVNLALALADAGRKVTIIDADLRRPKVTRYLGMVGGVGLTNILAGTAEVAEVVQKYGTGGVSVIAAGPTPPNPGELLASSHMLALVDELRSQNDYVLVDAPPLLPVADASGLAVMMDGVLLSVRYGSTTKEQLRQAATVLERVGARTLGVILNIVPVKTELAAAYGYGYSYGAAANKHGSE